VDLDICQHSKRVVSKLFEWHENLKTERAQIGTTISNEILKYKIELAKYKSKMEVASINFEMQLQMQKNKFHAREMKYRFALTCSLVVVAILMFFPVNNRYSSRFMLP
jgi:DNA-binding protein H-NS